MAKPRFTDAELDYLMERFVRDPIPQHVYFADRKGVIHPYCPDCRMQLTEDRRGHHADCPQALRYSIIGKIEAWGERKG